MRWLEFVVTIMCAVVLGNSVHVEAADTEGMLKALQQRQERAQTAFVTLETDVTMEVKAARGSFGWRGDPKAARDGLFTVRIEHQIRLKDDMFDDRIETPDGLRHNLTVSRRDSFNGLASYESTSGLEGGAASCIINPNPFEFGVGNTGLSPILLTFRPLHAQLGRFNFSDARIAEESVELNGATCVVLRETNEGAKADEVLEPEEKELWLEPSRDYALRRYQRYERGTLRFRLTVLNYSELPDFGSVPSVWDCETWNADKLTNSCQYRVLSTSVNQPMTVADFTHVPGPGTYVYDHAAGKNFRVSESGAEVPLPVHEKSAEKSANPQTTESKSAGQAYPWWLPLAGIVSVLSFLAVVLWTRGVFQNRGR